MSEAGKLKFASLAFNCSGTSRDSNSLKESKNILNLKILVTVRFSYLLTQSVTNVCLAETRV